MFPKVTGTVNMLVVEMMVVMVVDTVAVAYRTDCFLLCLEPTAALLMALPWERRGPPWPAEPEAGPREGAQSWTLLSPWPLGDSEPQTQVSLGTGPRGHQAGCGRVRGPRTASGQRQLEFIFGHVILRFYDRGSSLSGSLSRCQETMNVLYFAAVTGPRPR